MSSFHAYPSSPQSIQPYSRNEPLHADVVEFDTTGCFVPWSAASPYTTGCFVAKVPCIVEFHANILFSAPAGTSGPAVWFMKNQLPTVVGTIGGEMCGDDVVVGGGLPPYNVSSRVTRIMKLIPGDKVWCVPGINCGGNLTAAVAPNGNNTVNYFEGKILELL